MDETFTQSTTVAEDTCENASCPKQAKTAIATEGQRGKSQN
jgi:hypothetical protein